MKQTAYNQTVYNTYKDNNPNNKRENDRWKEITWVNCANIMKKKINILAGIMSTDTHFSFSDIFHNFVFFWFGEREKEKAE